MRKKRQSDIMWTEGDRQKMTKRWLEINRQTDQCGTAERQGGRKAYSIPAQFYMLLFFADALCSSFMFHAVHVPLSR